MTPLAKQDFVGLETGAWLFTGAEAPLHRDVAAAVHKYLHHRTLGPAGRDHNAGIEAACRSGFARLLGAEAADIALLSNASEAIAAVLQALRLQPGENIVLHALEYPSAVLGSLAWQEAGVQVRVIPHRDWDVDLNEILGAVDGSTRLVVTSQVSYVSGTRFDCETLYRGLQETSALLLVDATQALGVVPVDLKQADFVVSSSYKWLLGIHGMGVLALNPHRTGGLVPVGTGWRSVSDVFSPRRFQAVERFSDARRFEMGFPAFATLAALEVSTGVLLGCGIDRIETHVHALGSRLVAGLQELGLTVMTPLDAARRAGNIAFVCEQGEDLARQLAQAGVLAWSGDGRLRFSVHGFNDENDVDSALRETQKALHS